MHSSDIVRQNPVSHFEESKHNNQQLLKMKPVQGAVVRRFIELEKKPVRRS